MHTRHNSCDFLSMMIKHKYVCTFKYLHLHSLTDVLAVHHVTNEKALRETQTLRTGCSKAEPKNFAPPQAPSWGRGTAKI